MPRDPKDKAKTPPFIDESVPETIPFLDERIEFRGTTYLRSMNTDTLRDLQNLVVLQSESGERLAVLVGYEEYMLLQSSAMRERS